MNIKVFDDNSLLIVFHEYFVFLKRCFIRLKKACMIMVRTFYFKLVFENLPVVNLAARLMISIISVKMAAEAKALSRTSGMGEPS